MADRPVDPVEDDDDAALRWDGDEAPAPAKPSRAAEAADPIDAIVAEEADAEPDVAAPVVERGSSVLLVAYGVLGGIYLLFTIGWAISAQDSFGIEGLNGIMFVFGQWLAVAAPALWFGASFLLTRHRPAPLRLLWVVIGMLLLVPWPFILTR